MVRVGGSARDEIRHSTHSRRAGSGHPAPARSHGRDGRRGRDRHRRTRFGGRGQQSRLVIRDQGHHHDGDRVDGRLIGHDDDDNDHYDIVEQLGAIDDNHSADEDVGPGPCQHGLLVMSVEAETWRALGTGVRLHVSGGGNVSVASAAVRDVLERVDLAYSRFRPDSELSRINADGGRPHRISPLLADAIEAALRAATLTDGLVDPTVGRAMRAVGYDDDFERARNRTDPISIRLEPIPGWQAIQFDRRGRTIAVPSGVELDLGSTGKALAADLSAAAAVKALGLGGVLVSLGGDIATAGEPPAGGWRILAAEDSETPPDGDGEVIALLEGAIATSGTTVRSWRRGGIVLHHLIDPLTGTSVHSPWRTASVVAATCVDANTAATAAIVRGASAPRWLTDIGLAARLVGVNGDIHRIGTWPEAEAA
jgi:FAD:protein FMN transferase